MKKYFGLIGLAAALVACDSSSSSSDSGSTVTIKGGAALNSESESIFAAQTASELNIKIYKVAASTSALCTNPVTIFEIDEADAEYANFLGNPTLGSGELADGTYHCIIIEFADILKFTPSQDEGVACRADKEYPLEVCRAANGEEGEAQSFQLIDGTTGDCEDGEQRIAMYISTFSAAEGGSNDSNVFLPPASEGDETQGLKLNGAFVVSGATQGTFIADGTDAVESDDEGNRCDHQPPVFSFE